MLYKFQKKLGKAFDNFMFWNFLTLEKIYKTINHKIMTRNNSENGLQFIVLEATFDQKMLLLYTRLSQKFCNILVGVSLQYISNEQNSSYCGSDMLWLIYW